MQKNYFVVSIILLLAVGVALGGVYWYTEQNGFLDPTVFDIRQPSKPMAATLAYQQGTVLVRVDGSDWKSVDTDTVLHTGDQLSTGAESKAIVEFENGDVVRLGYTTEVTLTNLETTQVIIAQQSGATYNRVAKDPRRQYIVTSGDIAISALGTAFDVIEKEEAVDVGVIDSSVAIDTSADQAEVAQGSQATIDKAALQVAVSDINPDALKSEWYVWNKEEDSKHNNSLGIFEPLAGPTLTVSQPADGTTTTEQQLAVVGTVSEDATAVTVQGIDTPITDGAFSQTLTLEPGKNVITVIASDAEAHRTLKEVRVVFQTEAVATPLTLTGGSTISGVDLQWNKSTSATFKEYKVIRSTTNAQLAYPGTDAIAAYALGTERHADTTTEAGTNYYYRVCEVMTDSQSFCSNIIYMSGRAAAEPEPEPEEERVGIFLSGSASTSGIKLIWTVEGMSVNKGFKIIRSTSANPTYPTRDGDEAVYIELSDTRSYVWQATDGKTYHFRVCQYNGEGGCLVYSNDTAVTAITPDDSAVNVVMSAKAESTGVGLWWTAASDISGFKYYKVVRSEKNANLRYPDDGYIAVKGEGELSHRDFSAKKGTAYYYRICAVGDTIYCSNVVQVTAIHTNAAPSAVTLSATVTADGIKLAWTKSTEGDFSAYKIAWSQTDSTPAYPDNGYIKAISSASEVSYTDTGAKGGERASAVNVSSGTQYYSVCVLDSQSQVACSNTVTVIDGVIQ
ncbi:MAG: FecR domain-containing protein [Patescibacteria group bacterium]